MMVIFTIAVHPPQIDGFAASGSLLYSGPCVAAAARSRRIHKLQHYHWPGNVRELQNVLERMLIVSGDTVSIRDLPADLVSEDDTHNREVPSALKQSRDHAEREFVIDALRRNKDTFSQSAIELGVGRSYLHRRFALLKIRNRDFFL